MPAVADKIAETVTYMATDVSDVVKAQERRIHSGTPGYLLHAAVETGAAGVARGIVVSALRYSTVSEDGLAVRIAAHLLEGRIRVSHREDSRKSAP